MKKIILCMIISIFVCFVSSAQQESEHFYYSFGKKIYLQQRTDKLFFKFDPRANGKLMRTQIRNDASARLTPDANLDDGFSTFAVLEAKEGKQIPWESVEFCKTRADVVSITYLLQYKSSFVGLIDEFIILLKPTTSHEQLEELLKKNNCTVRKECRFLGRASLTYGRLFPLFY